MRFKPGGRCTRGAAVLIGVAVVLTLVGYLLSREARFPATVGTLDATPAQLFPLFNTREGHRRAWTLASERAGAGNLPPITHAAFGCTPGGVGTRTCFCPTGEGLGRVATLLGSLVRGQGEIAQSEPARRVVYDIDGGFMATRRTIEFEPVGDGVTRVVWVEEATATNPSMRYVLLGASRFPTFDGVRSAAGDLANAD